MALEAEAQNLLGEQSKLVGMQEAAPSIADKLREALQSRLEHPLMGQRADAISNFYQAAPAARAEAAGLLGAEGAPARPTAVENLVAQRRGSALTPVMGLTGLIGAKLGGIEDVIGQGTRAFQSQVAGQQGRVGLAQTSYNLALQELQRQAEEAYRQQQQQFQQQQWQAGEDRMSQQFPLELDLLRAQIAKANEGLGGGGGGGGGGGEWTGYVMEPTTTPQYSPAKAGIKEIVYDPGTNDWWEWTSNNKGGWE